MGDYGRELRPATARRRRTHRKTLWVWSTLPTIGRVTTTPPGFVGVAPDYRHTPKTAVALPDQDVVLPGGRLKWYDVLRDDATITDDDRAEARRTLLAGVETGDVPAAGHLGFVVHHLGDPYYFLLVCTWRNENELWETMWVRPTGGRFSLTADATHRPVLCVWEMGPLVHEQQAWVRFLHSPRDAEAVRAYLDDRYTGPVG